MSWDNRIFDEAFDAVGLREPVTPMVGGAAALPIMARFERPQEVMTAEGMHVTEYSIEYSYHDCPGLKQGSEVVIGGVRYRVTQPPTRQGDGYYAIAMLEPK